ncbi:MAG: fluoride efflux transporter FluC [Candidatus Planktophila sp.]
MLVSAGGVLGSLSRFLIDQFFISDRLGIIAANIVGCGLAAHILVLMERRGITWARYFLLPGFCGGMTTFSGVTFEAVHHTHENLVFLGANVFGSLIAIALMLPLSRKWIKVRV